MAPILLPKLSTSDVGKNLGASFPNLLDHNNADVAAISQNGSTYIYHYTSADHPAAQPTIHELIITGTPGSVNNQEAYNLSSPLVAGPKLSYNQAGQSSLYRPLAASNNVVPGLPGRVYVFWADKVTGDPTGLSGFAELQEISREVSNRTWPAMGQIGIPLGSSNSAPTTYDRRRKARRWGSWLG